MEINNYCTSGDTQIRYKLRGHYHFVATICFNKVSFAGRALAHQSFRHFGLHIIVQALLHGDFFTAKRCVIHFTTLPARYFWAFRVLTAKYTFSFRRHFTVFTKGARLESFTKRGYDKIAGKLQPILFVTFNTSCQNLFSLSSFLKAIKGWLVEHQLNVRFRNLANV